MFDCALKIDLPTKDTSPIQVRIEQILAEQESATLELEESTTSRKPDPADSAPGFRTKATGALKLQGGRQRRASVKAETLEVITEFEFVWLFPGGKASPKAYLTVLNGVPGAQSRRGVIELYEKACE